MGFKRVTDVDELHTIIPTPQLSGGGQGLQSLSMTISLMQTRESWGRPGSAIPLYDYLSLMQTRWTASCSVPHTHWLSLYLLLHIATTLLLGIHLKALTKTVSGDQKKFCCIILSFLYKRSSAWSRLKLITKMGFKHHPRTYQELF